MTVKRIGIVAGEASGDILGAGLMQALRRHLGPCEFSGIGGPRMLAEGFHSLAPLDRLSVMGLIEPLKRLPELLRLRRRLRDHFLQAPMDLVIGIDSPDFNLTLEGWCKQAGIPTAHYVSPSVWAWRQGRIHKIARSVDRMLCLFPFEAAFYQEHQVPVSFVGHPLADQLPLVPDRRAACQLFDIDPDRPVLTLLPGSRGSEVARLGQLFVDVARQLQQRLPQLQLLLPCASPERRVQIEALDLSGLQHLLLLDGQSHEAMTAASAVLLAAGTASLEAMLLKQPMVVAYRMAPLSHAIISRMVKIDHVALPNLLLPEPMIPEFIQQDAQVEPLAAALLPMLTDQHYRDRLQAEFLTCHQQLRQNADEQAAQALVALMESRRGDG